MAAAALTPLVARHEWRWAVILAVLVMALTMVPYGAASLTQTDEWRFSGFLLGVEDGNSYIAKMGQGARGEWLFRLPYTSEPQSGAFIYLVYLLLGRLSGPDHTARVFVFHITRLGCGVLMLLASYRFLAEFLPFIRQRQLGLGLVALSGGLGWVLLLFGELPIELYSPEAFSFLTLYSLPHLTLARGLFLLGLLAYLRGHGVGSGLALFGVALIQPLYVIVAWVVMSGEAATALVFQRTGNKGSGGNRAASLEVQRWFRTGPGGRVVLSVLLSSPVVLYSFLAFNADPLLRQWLAQNILLSAPPLHYLLGYGPLLVPALFGWRALRHRSHLLRFVLVWAALIPILLYLPITTQRRLIEGFQLPLVAAAVLGLTVMWRRWRRLAVPLVFALSLPTTVLIVIGGVSTARAANAPVFVNAARLRAFEWLNVNGKPDEVMLSAYSVGNEVPVYTPLTAYIGHGPETVELAQKQPRVAAFFRAATTDSDRQRLLAEGRITFVLHGPAERALGEFDPNTAAYLQPVYTADGYAIFRVKP